LRWGGKRDESGYSQAGCDQCGRGAPHGCESVHSLSCRCLPTGSGAPNWLAGTAWALSWWQTGRGRTGTL
jgi:hypothetical protein